MRILVSGSTGLVGSSFTAQATAGGHDVVRLLRSRPKRGVPEVSWDPIAGRIDTASLEGLDAVVHLAGESISHGRWTADKKARIRNSRVEGTRLLAEALAGLRRPPRVLLCASAIGFYGHRHADVIDEDSAPGAGFLAQVCQEWERAAQPAIQSGIRVLHLRLGVVLSPVGGALAAVLTPFRLGLGGVVGDGTQYMSWIALEDATRVIDHSLVTESLSAAVNAVAPHPVTNREYTETLGRVLSRPTLFPFPAFAARLALGEMADELLLSSTRVEPRRLIASGYKFRFPTLEGALRHMLGKQDFGTRRR